ncbi:MAG: acyl-CoA synthetase [Haloarculaceae archaeon]
MTRDRLDAYHFYERDWESYEELQAAFEFEIPETFNMATYTCERWAAEDRGTALYAESEDGREETYTFSRLDREATQLASYLADRGIERGDRVGVNLPTRPETLLTHLAAWKLGAVSVPLSTLFGPDALSYRLDDCSARACVVDAANAEALFAVRDDLDDLDVVLAVDGDESTDATAFETALAAGDRQVETATVDAEDDAMIIYTSGTTGQPKGVRHAHRFLLGNLPGYVMGVCNMQVEDGDVNWHVAQWSWVSSLFLGLFCPLFYGNPVLAHEGGPFDPERAFELVEKYDVVNFFAPPTGLRMMMQTEATDRFDVASVRTVSSGGEAVGLSIVEWAREVFDGAAVHEMYGQTEAHTGVTDCTALYEFREGKLGRPVVGVDLRIVDPETAEETVDPGEVGEFAIRYDHPACFKEYWNKPEKTAGKVHDGWLLYEDLGTYDEDGYFTFVSRKDDVIISAGYRIGPEEVEECLARHEAVADAGVIGVPDDERGKVPKAFVVLSAGHEPTAALEEDLRQFVRERLAKYEYPREIEFLDELPKTTTGKVRRASLRDREDRTDA